MAVACFGFTNFMFYPNFRQEKKLRRRGYSYIAGIDEAGRGAWAGPLVAAAVILDPKIKIRGIKDSKLLRAPERKEIFAQLKELAIAWAVGLVDEKLIDEIGLGEANLLAMKKALAGLNVIPHYFLADGFSPQGLAIPGREIIKGDYKVTSIAAASIIAKVTRDQIMDELDENFPQYGFKHHKGYGTAHHHNMLIRYGVSEIHRKSFKPIQTLIEITEE